jgi:hypothetical protein
MQGRQFRHAGPKTLRRSCLSTQGPKGHTVMHAGPKTPRRSCLSTRGPKGHTVMDRDSKLSPAKAIHGRELRDFMPRLGSAQMGDMWMNRVDARETAQARRAKHSDNKWSGQTRALAPLKVGDTVQNQSGNHHLRLVMKYEGFDQYN